MNRVFNQRYELTEKIGEGGMAVTYLAHDQLLAREVAVKVMREQFLGDEEFVERFRREAQSVAKLNHPNIASVYDIGQDQNALYMVMELVKGPNLKQLLRKRGRLSGVQAARIARQVAEALAKAHREGIVHRDIKPHNILLADGETVKVTDFGIARAMAAESLTKTHSIVGTVQYLSPEQARGETSVPASDLYSLGVVLYEMVTGQLPFSGENPVSIALKHAEEEPASPSTHSPDISEDLETVIYRALQKNLKDRYGSAREFAKDLESIEKGLSLDDTAERTMVISRTKPVAGDPRAAESLDHTVIRPPSVRELDLPSNADPVRSYPPPAKSSRAGGLVLALIVGAIAAGIGLLVAQNARPHTVAVPDLVHMSLNEAMDTLEEFKLSRGELKPEFNNDIPLDQIISQKPAPGERVEEGTAVDLVKSNGPKPPDLTEVPDVRDTTVAAAKRILSKAGLTLGNVLEVFHDTVQKGVVVRQSPSPGALIGKNVAIDLTVSKGIQPPPPPPADNKAKGELNYTLPADGPEEMNLRVETTDDEGDHVVYERSHKPGDDVKIEIEGVGETTVRWFVQDNLIDKMVLKPKGKATAPTQP
ncbi:MAG: Stk1 family PASTA domain-containing Ser/Thr kinase [Armatimonadetes bacterium]|nr:Stk1 family PASTA domain-containing Ser/Thr kinase [Armatimonadota bacterium]